MQKRIYGKKDETEADIKAALSMPAGGPSVMTGAGDIKRSQALRSVYNGWFYKYSIRGLADTGTKLCGPVYVWDSRM